jgi:serine/threonine-protein kinase
MDRRAQIEALFEAALDRPPEARAAWLDAHCDDPTVRAQVQRLLRAHDRADGILDRPVQEGAEASLPRRIGAYRLLDVIGRGGMGTVYRAERADGQFEQQVALKLMRPGLSPTATERFHAERQILASLEHPHIARLLDGGVTDGGRPYFVMEHVDGQPIDRYCDTHKLSVDARLQLFTMVCEAVQAAHQSLVVHRDLKPGNILVTEEGTVKLLDFGIAKLLRGDAALRSLTQSGDHVMTPEYAAPEQVRGEPVTTATDVYQLGLVLYELLAGQPPYRLTNRTPSEVERVICEEVPTRPSTAVTHAASEAAQVSAARGTRPEPLRRALQGDLDAIVMTALRKEPGRRYGAVQQLQADIERHRDGRPITARDDSLRYRVRKYTRRHSTPLAVAAAFVLLLVGYAVTVTAQNRKIAHERDKAEQVTSFLTELFEASDPREARGDTVTARELLARGVERAEALDDQPLVQAQVFDVVGRVYRSLGRYEQAQQYIERALSLRRERLQGPHPDLAASLNNLAEAHEGQGDFEAAEALYREALAMRKRLHGSNHALVAASQHNLGELLLEQAQYDEARPLLRASLATRRALLGDVHVDVAVSLNSLGLLHWETGAYDEAERLLREALAMRRELLGPEHPEIVWSLNGLALVLEDQGNLEQAEALYREAVAMSRQLYGEAHPEVAVALNNLAGIIADQGDVRQAETLYREALAMDRRMLGDDHPRVAVGTNNLAALLLKKGEVQVAASMYREAIDRFRRAFGEAHPHVAYPLLGRARVLLDQERHAAAERAAREALALRQDALPPDHWLLAETRSVLGASLAGQQRYAEAESLLVNGYQDLQAQRGPEQAETTRARRRLVALYEAWGRPDEAARYRNQEKTPAP